MRRFHFSKFVLLAIVTLVIILVSLFIVTHPSYNPHIRITVMNGDDWDLHFSWAEAIRSSILRYHQFPLWNPYRCGGAPLLGEPESIPLSLFLPFILLFGPGIGNIVSLFVFWAIGMCGMYLLGRLHGISRLGAIFASVVYTCSGMITIPFSVGMTNLLAYVFFPFVAYYLEQYLAKGKLWHAIGCGFFIAVMFLSGFHYLPMAFVFIGVFAVIRLLQINIFWQTAIRLGIVVLFFVGFSAVKLFPSIQLLKDNEVIVGSITQSGYSVKTLLFSLFSRDMTQTVFGALGTFRVGFVDGLSWELGENGMYIGIVSGFLFLIGFIFARKRFLHYYIVFFVFLWLAFGLNIAPSLFKFTHNIELFTFMRVAQRYRFVFMIPVALFAAIGLDTCMQYMERLSKGYKRIVLWIGIVGVTILTCDMLWVNTRVYPESVKLFSIPRQSTKPFVQVCSAKPYEFTEEYPTLLQDLGMRDCNQNVVIPTKAVDCKDEASYRGEAYMMHDIKGAVSTAFSPNILRVTVSVNQPDTLIINQNYDRGWIVFVNGKWKKVQNTQGLLSVYVSPGESLVQFYYLPFSFLLGGFVTFLTLVLSFNVLRNKPKGSV